MMLHWLKRAVSLRKYRLAETNHCDAIDFEHRPSARAPSQKSKEFWFLFRGIVDSGLWRAESVVEGELAVSVDRSKKAVTSHRTPN